MTWEHLGMAAPRNDVQIALVVPRRSLRSGRSWMEQFSEHYVSSDSFVRMLPRVLRPIPRVLQPMPRVLRPIPRVVLGPSPLLICGMVRPRMGRARLGLVRARHGRARLPRPRLPRPRLPRPRLPRPRHMRPRIPIPIRTGGPRLDRARLARLLRLGLVVVLGLSAKLSSTDSLPHQSLQHCFL
jgi:hypothetical protein